VEQTLDGGELGTSFLAECRVPRFRTKEYDDAGDWRGTWELDGGGAVMNQRGHTVDLSRWICGPVATVESRG
jgi:UDP-N-acetyl-2-amino-2-deoxyglucuronate dehydrogenase